MIAAAATALRTITFGDIDAGVWGVVLGAQSPAAVLDVGGVTLDEGQVHPQGTEEHGDWRLATSAGELTLTPASAAVRAQSGLHDGALAGFDQLCRVHGRLLVSGREVVVDCLGRRGCHPPPDQARLDSVRDVSAWFAEDDGVAVLALRPRKAAGHADDLLTVAVFDPEGPPPVGEARLSTAYGAGGRTARMGLELWLGEAEAEQYPRRVAGEAAGPRLEATTDGFVMAATLMRCHSRGRDGTGVFVLARPA